MLFECCSNPEILKAFVFVCGMGPTSRTSKWSKRPAIIKFAKWKKLVIDYSIVNLTELIEQLTVNFVEVDDIKIVSVFGNLTPFILLGNLAIAQFYCAIIRFGLDIMKPLKYPRVHNNFALLQ